MKRTKIAAKLRLVGRIRTARSRRGDEDCDERAAAAAAHGGPARRRRPLRWHDDDVVNADVNNDSGARLPPVSGAPTTARRRSLSDLVGRKKEAPTMPRIKSWQQFDGHDESSGHYTPLHTILREKKVSTKAVRKIMTAHPASLTAKGPLAIDSMTPLHTLMASAPRKTDAAVLDLFIERYPPSSADALEGALGCFLPADIINVVLEFVPRPALVRDANGQTPLHILCSRIDDNVSSSSASSVMKVLLRLASSEPCALSVADERGCTPLHYFLSSGGCDRSGSTDYARAFDILADLAPSSTLTIADQSGMTPLHVACMNGGDSDVVRSILNRAGPESAEMKTAGGYLPLQVYISIADWEDRLVFDASATVDNNVDSKRKFLGVVKDLARAYPAALTTPFPRANFALLEYMREEGGHYHGQWREEVEVVFREVLAENKRKV